MMGLGLYDYQLAAIKNMKNGCILCGGVGSGKSRTALGYYYRENGLDIEGNDHTSIVNKPHIQDLYVITTARKRDSKDWESDMAPFLLSTDPQNDAFDHITVVDSWNNILKYKDVRDSFFIFDEQRVVGSGVWVKTFWKIAKHNKWILLSATPGDTWSDYIPVFVANGFYKNRTEFNNEHIIWSRFANFPKIDRYIGINKLNRLRNDILVDMDFHRKTKRHYEIVECDFDKHMYKSLLKERWNPYDNCPIENGSKLYYLQRRVSNSSQDRINKMLDILKDHPKSIIFYNYDYELDALRIVLEGILIPFAEYNGHKHEPVPTGEKWAYLVQYTAGNEAWNCIETDTMIFFSQNPSYKVLEQSSGRIDRLNTPFEDLYYYRLKSDSPIDAKINAALINKKNFNSRDLVRGYNQKYFAMPAKPNKKIVNEIISDPLPDEWEKLKNEPDNEDDPFAWKYEQTRLFY